jgi:hypothetical protein
VGDDHPGDGELADRRVHLALAFDVEGAGRLVEEQELRPLVERPRQENPLPLSAGQAGAHVAHQRVPAHRHCLDLVGDRGDAGALPGPRGIGVAVEEGDVVDDRAGEELVFLHHRADHVAPGAQAHLLQVDTADPDLPGLRREDAEHALQQGRLAAARRPDDRDRVSRLDAQAQPAQHRLFRRRVGKP